MRNIGFIYVLYSLFHAELAKKHPYICPWRRIKIAIFSIFKSIHLIQISIQISSNLHSLFVLGMLCLTMSLLVGVLS